MKKLLGISILLLAFNSLHAEEVASVKTMSLDSLLQSVKTSSALESKENVKRENAFKTSISEQKKLLKSAREELVGLNKTAESLKKSYEVNEKSLSELEEKLKVTMGTLGEMYGVVRQTSADAYSSFENSLVTIEHQERLAFLKNLSGKKVLANSKQLRQLWFELLNEASESAKVSKFESTVLNSTGEAVKKEIVRVGSFNIVSGGEYLQYLPETKDISALTRQPKGGAMGHAEDLQSLSSGFTTFTVDPTRGVLLSKLVNAPKLSERIEQGGIVGYVILAVLLVGLIIVGERLLKITKMAKAVQMQAKTTNIIPDNPLGKIFKIYKDNSSIDTESLEIKLGEAIMKIVSPLEKGVTTIKIFAAIAPLLGLLGTVTGMIGTFQSITLFGTGDPKLMAGGISQALVTTVLGLVAAIPLILLHSFVASKSKNLTSFMEEQAAGLLVEKIEAKEV